MPYKKSEKESSILATWSKLHCYYWSGVKPKILHFNTCQRGEKIKRQKAKIKKESHPKELSYFPRNGLKVMTKTNKALPMTGFYYFIYPLKTQLHGNVRGYFKDNIIYELVRQRDLSLDADFSFKKIIADYHMNLYSINWNWIAEILKHND